MFDLLPNALSALISVVFPALASYKALTTSSPAHLKPWLTYFLVLTLFHTLEWTPPLSIIPAILPLYSYARLFVHIYLLLPGETQGATFIYVAYVEPFIAHHERTIEALIANVHSVASALGITNLEKLWELLRVNIFGLSPTEQSTRESRPPPPPASNSYVSSLLSRFTDARAPAGGDVYSLLGNAAAAFVGGGAGRGSIIPSNIAPGDRAKYIEEQRRKLRDLLDAYDREAIDIGGASSYSKRNHSEPEFDTISPDEADQSIPGPHRQSSGWGEWLIGAGKQAATDYNRGRTSGHDLAYGGST